MIFKTATLVDDYDWIYSEDDALDSSGEDFATEYAAAMETADASRLKLLPGQKPALWRIRHVRGMAKKVLTEHVIKHMVEGQYRFGMPSCYLAVQLALVGCRDLVDDLGVEVEIPTHFSKEYNSQIVTETFMREINEIHSGRLVNEMGSWVISRLSASKNS